MTTTPQASAGTPLNRKELELLDLFVRGPLGLAPIAAKHSTWLLAVGGAAAALLIGHIEDFQKLNRFAQFWLGTSAVLLAVAMLFGLVARWKATSLEIIIGGAAFAPNGAALADAHSEQQDDEEVDAERVVKAFVALLPKSAQGRFEKSFARAATGTTFAQLQGKEALRTFGAQFNLLRLQYAFTFGAAFAALLGIAIEFLLAGVNAK